MLCGQQLGLWDFALAPLFSGCAALAGHILCAPGPLLCLRSAPAGLSPVHSLQGGVNGGSRTISLGLGTLLWADATADGTRP